MLLKQRIDEALDVATTIGLMDLKLDLKIRLNTNRTTLTSLKSQITNMLTPANRQSTYKSTPTRSNNSGCYIATMAYGDYDHPQVLILRRFRDDILDKSYVGKSFINFYYHYSPKLVTHLQNKKYINTIIRKILNLLINLIQL